MRILGPVIFGVIVTVIFGSLQILLLRYLNRSWWQVKALRRSSYLLPVVGLAGIAMWLGGLQMQGMWLPRLGASLAIIVFIICLALILSLPFSGIFNKLSNWFDRKTSRQTGNGDSRSGRFDNGRRIFLRGTAALFPLSALSAGGGGIAGAFGETRVYPMKIEFSSLPKQLEGFRFLHLSDSHLGIYKFLGDLEDVLVRAEGYRPDVILYTGDMCDDLKLLPRALEMIWALNPPHGAYASVGNHEYYRGINEVLRSFQNSPVVLLRSSGVNLNIRGVRLYLAGADDPVTLHGDTSKFMRATIDKALENCATEAFKILMTHRPEGFVRAAERGVDLTLAGHTHGGQVGVSGRSFWQMLMPDRYLWGRYDRGDFKMYLSSGIGHWFPFRLGCPTEAPIIELTSVSESSSLR
jgi:predicted MPP superfamily phosphohydrolase